MPDPNEKTQDVNPDSEKQDASHSDTSEKDGLRAESTRKLQAYSELVKVAEERGHTDPKELLSDLERENIKLYAMIEASQRFGSSKPPEPNGEPKRATPKNEPPVFIDTEARSAALRVTMTNDWRDFKRNMPDNEVTKKDLDNILNDPIYQAAIAKSYHNEMNISGDANFYQLAYKAHLLVKGDAPKKKQDTEKEPPTAQYSASLPKGTPAEGGKKPTSDQEFLDGVIPDDAPLRK